MKECGCSVPSPVSALGGFQAGSGVMWFTFLKGHCGLSWCPCLYTRPCSPGAGEEPGLALDTQGPSSRTAVPLCAEQMTSPASTLTCLRPSRCPGPHRQQVLRKCQTLGGLTPARSIGPSRDPSQGNEGSRTHTYDLGWREVWKTLLRGRGVLAGLAVSQWALLLGRCGKQAEEGFDEGHPGLQWSLSSQECLVT